MSPASASALGRSLLHAELYPNRRKTKRLGHKELDNPNFDLCPKVRYVSAMPDQYGVVTNLLKKMGLADWHVVEPVPGGLRGNVLIQNDEKRIYAYVLLEPADVDALSEETMIARIQSAIAKPTDDRYRS